MITSERLALLLSGEAEPTDDVERGAIVMVALNYHQIRQEEDRGRMEQVRRVAGELAVGWGRAKGQAA